MHITGCEEDAFLDIYAGWIDRQQIPDCHDHLTLPAVVVH